MAAGAVCGFLISLLATVLLISGMVLDNWITVGTTIIGPFRSCQEGKCSIEIPRKYSCK